MKWATNSMSCARMMKGQSSSSTASLVVVSILLSLLFSSSPISAVDSINATQSLQAGSTLTSSGGSFELGFFSPPNTQKRYLGIWYKKISTFTVVWVANRNSPLNDSSPGEGLLTFIDGNNLAVTDSNGSRTSNSSILWSTNSSGLASAISPIAQLLETGNLVIRDSSDRANNPQVFLWQSFDFPGDTFLPGMKYGLDLRTGLNRALTSWRTPTDPGVGSYANTLDPSGVPEFFLTRGSFVDFRSGSWNGKQFGGMINLKPNSIYTYEFVSNQDEIYYRYELTNSSVVSRMVLTSEGNLQRFTWVERTGEWNLYLTAHTDNCDRYALCGPNGICNINNSPACGCLTRFVPKFAEEWNSADWSNGCGRDVPLNCSPGEGFVMYSGIKIPDTRQSWYNTTMELKDCERTCRDNCSCTAYANMDVRNGGTGCILWFGDLVDIRQYNDNNGQDIYIRFAASEMEKYGRSNGKKRVKIIVISISVAGFILLALCVILRIQRRRKHLRVEASMTGSPEETEEDEDDQEDEERMSGEGGSRDLELPLFQFATIADATNNFSAKNKLGQGGYGPVYKGVLKNGRTIAVKRLSKRSRQGTHEFKNEVVCIAKLQHRNLVKLLGCCIQSDERMLIYEYMPNKSLNFFIFDKRQSVLLDWPKRLHIINGIARGLLYLHQDSRLRIIHRDMKASNVLLDHEMNPKISDFGMARSFAGDESSANTKRIVGTYGYMSPEYAIDGLFSVKSDVFSFGVLVLEIISGRKNRGFSHTDHKLNLLGHAWMLQKEGRSHELAEECVRNSCSDLAEVERAVHIGLMCVQQSPEDRPNMSSLVVMLSSEIELAQPKEPGFFTERDILEASSSMSKHEYSSSNKLSETLIDAR
ncbi:G-type lectin S-receptor-like serine/threonine-protein kinase At4g27290 [Linum perenne]